MRTHGRESGMSVLGILAILLMVGFFVMCAIRISPPYFEYLSVRKIISTIAAEPEAVDQSASQLRRQIDANFNTNQIYELNAKDIKIFRRKGRTYIEANYEVRIPIVWRIDAMLRFDDLTFVAGQAEPISPQSIPQS